MPTTRRARAGGGSLVLVGPNPEVREIFDLPGTAHALPIVESREEAFADLHRA